MAELRPHARITGEARNAMAGALVEKYVAGASIRDLAEEYGRSYGFVHRVLSEAGVQLRGRGSQPGEVRGSYSRSLAMGDPLAAWE